MINNCPKNVLKIAFEYQYKVQLYRCFVKDFAYIRIFDPYYRSPYPYALNSCVRSYAYCKRLFDSVDIRSKL